MAATLHSILLLPQHITPTPSHLPILKAIQTVLNESYTKTYCAHPEIFGTEHVRLADPAQLQDIVGEDGFTIVLVRTSVHGALENVPVEVLATGSVKTFGDGDVESYAQWSTNLSGSEWAAGEQRAKAPAKKSGGGGGGGVKYEVTAFGVAVDAQAGGLGARLLRDIEWLVSRSLDGRKLGKLLASGLPMIDGLGSIGSSDDSQIEGVDLDRLKNTGNFNQIPDIESETGQESKPKLVLVGIRELGNEAYYQRRGFKSVWSGTVPVGMWACRQECTMVYMEKDIQ